MDHPTRPICGVCGGPIEIFEYSQLVLTEEGHVLEEPVKVLVCGSGLNHLAAELARSK